MRLLALSLAFVGGAWADVAPKLISVRVMPAERILRGKNSSQQFVVLGRFADGRERDVTAQARLTLSSAALARADQSARVFALADGQTVLTATVGALSARASLKIEESNLERPFSFPRD